MCWYRPCPNDRCFIAMITVRSRVVAFLQKLLAQRVTGKNAKVRCRGSRLLNIPAPCSASGSKRARFHPAGLVPSVHQLTAEGPMSGTQSKSLIHTKTTSGGTVVEWSL